MPLPADATGPQNEAERRLYDLILQGLDSGEGKVYECIEDLGAELRAPRQGDKR